MNFQQTKTRLHKVSPSCVKPHEILDIGYKKLLANTNPGLYAEWFPEEKDKLDVSTLRPKPTWALS